MEVDFLSVDDCLQLHENQIELYGGESGVRDIGLLESGVAQASIGFGGEYRHHDINLMAAAYMFHIVQNHPFIDGNKRAGLAAALVFLDFNGIELSVEKGMLYDLTIATATGNADKEKIAGFFRQNSRERKH